MRTPIKPGPNFTRNVLLLLMTAVVLSVCYYFVVALPAVGKARLEFEKQKYADEQKAKQRESQLEMFYRMGLGGCLKDAEDSYWAYVKLNGERTADGSYEAPRWLWDDAAKRRKAAVDECVTRWKLR